MAKNISVYGIFRSRAAIDRAVLELQRDGFRHQDVSILLHENVGNKDLVAEKNTKSPEGAVAGGTAGAVVGGALGWLAGIGALAVPGIGPFIAAGPIMAALAGVGAGAALGGVSGGLIGMGLPEFEAKRYEGRVRDGGSLLSVHCDDSDWADRAEAILKGAGGDDITRAGEASADYDKTDRPRSYAART